MHFKSSVGHKQIITRAQRVQYSIVVNAFNCVEIIIIMAYSHINDDSVIFAHEPLHECGIQHLVARHIKVIRSG